MKYGGVSVPSVNVESITRLNLEPNGYIGEGAEVGKALNFVLYVALKEASIQKVLNQIDDQIGHRSQSQSQYSVVLQH